MEGRRRHGVVELGLAACLHTVVTQPYGISEKIMERWGVEGEFLRFVQPRLPYTDDLWKGRPIDMAESDHPHSGEEGFSNLLPQSDLLHQREEGKLKAWKQKMALGRVVIKASVWKVQFWIEYPSRHESTPTRRIRVDFRGDSVPGVSDEHSTSVERAFD